MTKFTPEDGEYYLTKSGHEIDYSHVGKEIKEGFKICNCCIFNKTRPIADFDEGRKVCRKCLEKRRARITCGCGVVYSKGDISRHNASKRHQCWVHDEVYIEKTPFNKSEYEKKYREKHSEEIKIRKKLHKCLNEEKYAEYSKTYYESNKEKIHAHIFCDCGATSSIKHIKRHELSKKHQSEMNKLNSITHTMSSDGIISSNQPKPVIYKKYLETRLYLQSLIEEEKAVSTIF